MTDQADAGATPAATIIEAPASAPERMSPSDAARMLANLRKPKEQNSSAEAPRAASAETPSGDEPAAAPLEEAPGETTETPDPQASEPAPIEPPRSWTKEAKERWQSLPRETQDYLASREQERERELRRGQNDAAEARKAIDAERGKVEEARQQYETALPALLATLKQQQMGDFADIKTLDDVERLARADWPRYALWDAQQKRIGAVQQQVAAATARQAQEKQAKLAEFIGGEAKLLAEKMPEIADPAQRTKLQEAAVAMLRDVGFADGELAELYQGQKEISLHDHRLQLLIRDGLRYRSGQSAVRQATAKPLPPVQRPGSSQPRGAAQDAAITNLTQKLDKTGSVQDAVRLIAARRAAAR